MVGGLIGFETNEKSFLLTLSTTIFVSSGVNKQFNTRITRELALSFFFAYPKLTAITLKQFHLLERHFKQGIAAYSVRNDGDFVLSYTPSHYDKVGPPTMTVGLYEGHAFLITDINKVTNNYTCGECSVARFTKADNLNRHATRCTRRRTNISCPGNRILAPESAFEKAFTQKAVLVSKRLAGYHPETKTVFQFHGFFWHGCIKCFPKPEQRTEVICIDCKGNEIIREAAYRKTVKRSEVLRSLGYRLLGKPTSGKMGKPGAASLVA